MSRLSKQDNDALRSHEWRLVFPSNDSSVTSSSANTGIAVTNTSRNHGHAKGSGAGGRGGVGGSGTTGAGGSISLETAHPLPAQFAHDTFLIKAWFNKEDKSYVVLVTNLKQTWMEKMELEAIRTRSMNIKTFAYEEDSQIEALLISLAKIFSPQKTSSLHMEATSSGSSSSSLPNKNASLPEHKCRLESDHGQLSLRVEFAFGLAPVEWEFKLQPMSANSSGLGSTEANIMSNTRSPSKSIPKPKGLASEKLSLAKRKRLFLEDSDDEDGNNEEPSYLATQPSQSLLDDWALGPLPEEEGGADHSSNNIHSDGEVDGSEALFDHVSLPLISILNVYRRQIQYLENVVRFKESEIDEALHLLEAAGGNVRNRRRGTEPYAKGSAEARLASDIEMLVSPQLHGPRELFSEKRIPELCSIVAQNAAEKEFQPSHSASLLERDTLSQSALTQGLATARRPAGADMSTLTMAQQTQQVPGAAAAVQEDAPRVDKAALKEQEELERRRKLMEELDAQKLAKEKSKKKKKLF